MSSAVPTLKVVSGLDPMFIARRPPPRPTLAAVVFVSWLLLCLLLRIAGSSRQKRTNQSKRRVR